jgi:hypothetical protein
MRISLLVEGISGLGEDLNFGGSRLDYRVQLAVGAIEFGHHLRAPVGVGWDR